MEFPAGAAVQPQKLAALRALVARLGIDLPAVEEKFAAGGGHGGQKTNRSRNCVQLKYRGISVRCRRERSLSLNRFLALRELAERIEMQISPQTSQKLQDREKIRKSKLRRRARRDNP
ncbi:MAG: peptide chain release factor-like protein [Elusimicrobiales bacterium]